MKQNKIGVYISEEPVEYGDFSGGMNTNKNDLGLLNNQFKLGVNLNFDGNNLITRTGGKQFIELSGGGNLNKVQGIFMFSSVNKYIVVANDGKLYYGLYQPNSKIILNYMPILIKENDYTVDSYKVSNGLLEFYPLDAPTQNHDGYMEIGAYIRHLVFQNKFKIEAIQYKDKMYVATGTRIIQIDEQYISSLVASVVSPYKPNSIEYKNIGPNLLSYIPSVHVELKSKGVATQIHNIIPLKKSSGKISINAVFTFAEGETEKDYRMKWEHSTDGINYTPVIFPLPGGQSYISKFQNDFSLGMISFEVDEETALTTSYRCSFARSFKRETDPRIEEEERQYIIENEDWVVDKIDGEWFGQAGSVNYTPDLYITSNEFYNQIQSCKKIFGYGNKFLFYDDAYNSGNMWKTAIDNPLYISYKGGINFKTDKDEQIIRIINFKGILVCFAYNNILGGNISVINGNGDDYNDGQTYSPFTRTIINKTITSDNAYSIQIAENIIIFKYRESLYMISGSDLNSEIVDVQEINTHLKQENLFIKIPWDDNDCISELTEDYYGLYWKDKYDADNNLVHPAYRLKLYYKIVYTENGRIYFPAIIDKSNLFNTNFIIQIAGKNYVYYNKKIISFNEKYYKDLNENFEYDLVTKGYGIGYPQFVKSIKSIMVSYSNDERTEVTINPKVYNESMFEMLKSNEKFFDNNVINEIDTSIKTDSMITNFLLIKSNLREDCMTATVRLSGIAEYPICFNSIVFYYKIKSVPKKSPLEKYRKIIRKGERLTK